jgi:Outer membrane protein beta-barrel domain
MTMKKVAVTYLMLGVILSLTTYLTADAQVRRKTYKPKFQTQADVNRANAEYRREVDERRTAPVGNPDYQRPNRLIEMTFRVAPSVSFNTVEGSGVYGQFDANGIGIRMSVGPSLDYFFFKDRYAFSSGLWYTIKRSAYTMPGSFGQERLNPGLPVTESVYNLQYLQVPLTVKMFANNLGPNLRGYVQCGGLMDIKLAEKPLDKTTNALYKYAMRGGDYERQYTLLDLGVLLGAGVQYKINPTNALNLGLSYQRGLTSVMRNANLDSRNNTIAVEMGFKF